MTTDRAMARSGLLVSDRAAAGGPIIRLKISSAPTTGSVMLVATATTSRNSNSIRLAFTPRAAPDSWASEDSSSGRYIAMMATMHTTAPAAMGRISLELMPRISPSISTSVSAVATSWRPRRPSQPITSAPASANTPSPTRVLTPIRLAPAAPAKAPWGTASATNADPRMTTKNPTTPATTATMVATTQAFIMKGWNTPLPPGRGGRARGGGGQRGRLPGRLPARPPGRPPGRPAAPVPAAAGELGQQVAREGQRDHEEAHRPAVVLRRPGKAVVGQHDADPGDGHADQGGRHGGQPRPAGDPQRDGGRADEQRRGQDGAHRQRGQRHGQRDGQQAGQPDGADPDAARGGQ